MQFLTNIENNPLGSHRMLTIFIGLIAVIGAIALIAAPVSAADFFVAGTIQPSMNLSVQTNTSLTAWNLTKHQDNVLLQAFRVNLESDYPIVKIMVNESSSNPQPGYMWSTSKGSLSQPLRAGATLLNGGAVELVSVTDTQSPYLQWFPLSQLLNGDKAGTYSAKLTVTAVVG